ncbi:hypothetical protein AB0395_34905 [Streptosporangium sp. NPDC051023]|uniref:hypothetical protein n=1 Tax=Streptosporangium sp. NPDC051023 TaxID=3155410 RepID=UPI00344E4119
MNATLQTLVEMFEANVAEAEHWKADAERDGSTERVAINTSRAQAARCHIDMANRASDLDDLTAQLVVDARDRKAAGEVEEAWTARRHLGMALLIENRGGEELYDHDFFAAANTYLERVA